MNMQENMFLFAQMVGEWLFLYEYILMQTKIFLWDQECLVIHYELPVIPLFKKFWAFSQKSETITPDWINQSDPSTH